MVTPEPEIEADSDAVVHTVEAMPEAAAPGLVLERPVLDEGGILAGYAPAAPWRPAAPDGEDLPLNEVVGQALGTASVCWANVAGAGEFDSARAAWVLEGLMAYLNRVVDGVIAGTAAAAAGVEPAAAGDGPRPAEAEGFTDRPCSNERAHWRHPWFGAREDGPTVAVGAWWCWGRPRVVAAFADHRYVDVLRCYGGGGEPCRRMLVAEQPDGLAEPGDAHGWALRETPGRSWGGERRWLCPAHSGRGG